MIDKVCLMDGFMDVTDGCIDRLMDNGLIDSGMEWWMDIWIGRLMGGWIDR